LLREKVLALTELILEYLEKAGIIISLFAVAVIIVGFAIAAWRYARRFRGSTQESNFNLFKIELGSALLLGLEILVLADVIETITVTPTFLSLVMLAAIVVIRTAVSWTLTLETEGCWPWQASAEGKKSA
jgi:uncharacterized membrane protein